MLDQLNALLRKRFEADDEVSAAPSSNELNTANVTPFTPAPAAPKIDDMSDRAEAAIHELSETLKKWCETDLRVLFDAWTAYENGQNGESALNDVFRASHNLSGMGETYGEPEIGRICSSLCKLINSGMSRKSIALARLHIDACRAVQASTGQAESAEAICLALETEVTKLGSAAA